MTVFYGAVINPNTLTTYRTLPRCLLAVGSSGDIEWMVDDVPEHQLQETLARNGSVDADFVALHPTEFLLPGFIDTHTHAPQYPNIGSGQQYELLDWLSQVTFPTEAKFSEPEFANRTYKSVVRRVIDSGTTTCCYFGTLHLDATKILADVVRAEGQRAFVGKCSMDQSSPSYYTEPSVEVSVDRTKALIDHIHTLSSPTDVATRPYRPSLVQPIITPRFAISCSARLLSSLGELATSNPSLRIQTHLSENTAEVALTRKLFPDAKHYTGVYDSFGLLRKNTILAHAIHLEDAEIELIKMRGAGISHCPNSNFNLTSGIAPIGHYLDQGIKVGLGTDVSGGFSFSILNAIQNASIAAKVVTMNAEKYLHTGTHDTGNLANRPLSIATLLYLATLGGAKVCDLDERVGSFAPGKSFDALLKRM